MTRKLTDSHVLDPIKRWLGGVAFKRTWSGQRKRALGIIVAVAGLLAEPSQAALLWSDLGATQVRETGPGSDILGAGLKRDDSSTDTLYFKFHVDPISAASTEYYFAGFQLFEGNQERLGVGNAQDAF